MQYWNWLLLLLSSKVFFIPLERADAFTSHSTKPPIKYRSQDHARKEHHILSSAKLGLTVVLSFSQRTLNPGYDKEFGHPG
jgi:hypothetical protein